MGNSTFSNFLFPLEISNFDRIVDKKWAIKDENPNELQGLCVTEKEEVTFHLLI
jgi:hypothetical protein